jgi:HAD superfamily hydrolase (TIGR01490 family)
MAGHRFAVFDIDGTIIRWQLYHALADDLAKAGHLDPKEFDKVRVARMAWKKRVRETSFNDYEETLVKLIDRAITNIRAEDLQAACQRVLLEYKDQVYIYTRDLIQELKVKNYLLFAISASQAEIVELLAAYYGFDDYGGSLYEIKNGYFTGRKDVLKSDRKPVHLQKLVAKHGADWAGSIGVGDSESDIPMLAIVEQPIAFNPTRNLYNYAVEHSWPVVIERKNMIYRLEPENGEYRLKTPD